MLTRDRGTGVVAVGFGLAIALAAVLLFTGTGESASVEWTAGAAVPSPLPPGLTMVDDAIPVGVVPEVQVWTGSELLTFGTRGSRNVGAVYEPSTGRWHAMSAPPFGTVLHGPAAVWTGESWVVVGILCRVGASSCDGALAAAEYDPGTDSWTSIDANPQPAAGTGRGHGPVVGRGVGMLGSSAAFVLDGQYYAFRPDSRDWDWLPAPPASDGVACSVDGDIVVPDVKTATVSVLAPGRAGVDHRTRHRFRDQGSDGRDGLYRFERAVGRARPQLGRGLRRCIASVERDRAAAAAGDRPARRRVHGDERGVLAARRGGRVRPREPRVAVRAAGSERHTGQSVVDPAR